MAIEHSQASNETSDPFAPLYSHQYVQLSTFRKNGISVPTPIWFANDQGKLYMVTSPTTGKVKRIRNNAKVLLAPCTGRGKVLGEQIEGRAHVLPEAQYEKTAKILIHKYGFIYHVFAFIQKLRKIPQIFIEVESL